MASNEYLFNILATLGKMPPNINPKDAPKWFADKIKTIKNVNIANLTTDLKKKSRLTPANVGQMFMFFYNPKYREQLPYYDRFPCVFPVLRYPDGFLGINLHYLPPFYRAKLMNALWKTENRLIGDKKKFNINYRILQSATRYAYFEPCLKRYLFSHVQSPFFVVPPEEWDLVCMLPTEKFVKAGKNQIWIESLGKVGEKY